MTVVTNRNEIANQSVFPVSINMMDYKDSFILNIAVIASFIKYLPSILPITSWHLFLKRFRVPIFKSTSLATISSTTGLIEKGRNYIEYLFTIKTLSFNLSGSRFKATNTRTKVLRLSRVFPRNKFFITLKARICNNWFFAKNATTFMATCNMARFVTFRYCKLTRTDRANFGYFFHRGILS
jgi:hypothetical protein